MAKDQVKPELWKSRSINFHLTSRYPQVLFLVDTLLDEVIAHIKKRDKPKRIHTAKLKKSLSLVVLNLYSLHKVNRKKYIAYPRNPNEFFKLEREYEGYKLREGEWIEHRGSI